MGTWGLTSFAALLTKRLHGRHRAERTNETEQTNDSETRSALVSPARRYDPYRGAIDDAAFALALGALSSEHERLHGS
jgi:hypothetical protein